VAKIWADHNLKPWRVETFKVSNDPHFEDKLVDVVGLYLNPPCTCGGVLLGREDPVPSPGPHPTVTADEARPRGHDDPRPQTQRHHRLVRSDEHRHPGEVLTGLNKAHTGADVLKFFKQIDATVPRGLAVHVVLDNLSAYSTPEIKKWLAHRDRRRWHLHFTPTSISWLDLIERWFKELTDRRLRRGVFTSVSDLAAAITTWAEHWNTDPKPFWKATAEDIITKVQRGRETLRQINTQTDH
jgi:transposase